MDWVSNLYIPSKYPSQATLELPLFTQDTEAMSCFNRCREITSQVLQSQHMAVGQYQAPYISTFNGMPMVSPIPSIRRPFEGEVCINVWIKMKWLHLNTTGTIQFDDQLLTDFSGLQIRKVLLLSPVLYSSKIPRHSTCEFFIHGEQQSQVMVKCLVQLQYILVNTWTCCYVPLQLLQMHCKASLLFALVALTPHLRS